MVASTYIEYALAFCLFDPIETIN